MEASAIIDTNDPERFSEIVAWEVLPGGFGDYIYFIATWNNGWQSMLQIERREWLKALQFGFNRLVYEGDTVDGIHVLRDDFDNKTQFIKVVQHLKTWQTEK